MISQWIFGSFILVSLLVADSLGWIERTIKVDLSDSGCDNINGYDVGDRDLVLISHQPRFNTISTRDYCEVTFRTRQGRRLEYSIDSARFYECGIDIKIYHAVGGNTNVQHMLRCNGNFNLPIRDKSPQNIVRMSIRMVNPMTTNYAFTMRMTNDMEVGLDKTLDDDIDDYQGEALDPGIIAGIGIAGAIIIIALILLAIYLCIRARQTSYKDNAASNTREDSSVFTTGNSQVHFPSKERYPRGRYGSMEDINSTTSQEKAGTNGTYTNPAYTPGPREEKSQRQASFGRAGRKAGFQNAGYEEDDMGRRTAYDSWEEDEVKIGSFRRPQGHDDSEVRMGSHRRSRRDEFQLGEKKQLKSAMKKPTNIEMSKVNTQPINGILKTRRPGSPNRSQTSSTEGSFDMNALVHGYSHSKAEHPNIKHKPVIERRRSRSGTRSNRSTSSVGSQSRRAHSADRKPKPKSSSRMYSQDVFIRDKEPQSKSRSRARSSSAGRRRDRGSDSIDSESSATSSRRVNMNPGGKRVHIKGEETDI